jgi:hypothetical protein
LPIEPIEQVPDPEINALIVLVALIVVARAGMTAPSAKPTPSTKLAAVKKTPRIRTPP